MPAKLKLEAGTLSRLSCGVAENELLEPSVLSSWIHTSGMQESGMGCILNPGTLILNAGSPTSLLTAMPHACSILTAMPDACPETEVFKIYKFGLSYDWEPESNRNGSFDKQFFMIK